MTPMTTFDFNEENIRHYSAFHEAIQERAFAVANMLGLAPSTVPQEVYINASITLVSWGETNDWEKYKCERFPTWYLGASDDRVKQDWEARQAEKARKDAEMLAVARAREEADRTDRERRALRQLLAKYPDEAK